MGDRCQSEISHSETRVSRNEKWAGMDRRAMTINMVFQKEQLAGLHVEASVGAEEGERLVASRKTFFPVQAEERREGGDRGWLEAAASQDAQQE